MSNHLAIATVTASLRHVLQEYLPLDVPSATVTAMRPDTAASGLPNPGVNLFLYRVSINPSFRNEDLPTRSSDGTLMNRPRVALNLHYLCSFYGDETRLESQQVLGSFMRILEARPLITGERIQSVLSDPLYAFLIGTDLGSQVEKISISPEDISIDDMSKIWSTLLNTTYPLSTGYMARAVLIEAPGEIGKPLPVLERNITVSPITPMTVSALQNSSGPLLPISFGNTMTIIGSGFTSAITVVEIDAVSVTGFTTHSLNRIDCPLTDTSLRAGAAVVRLKTDHFQSSNSLAFLLRPTITIDSGAVTATALPVDISPSVGRTQTVRLFLNEYQVTPPSQPRQYILDAPENNGISDPAVMETTSITFDVTNIPAGTYLVRLEVDGAESALERTEVSGVLTITDPRVIIP